jgi:ABC-type sulfate transport system permease component
MSRVFVQRTIWIAIAIVGLVLLVGLLPIDSISSPASRRQLQLSVALAAGSAVIAILFATPLAVILTRVVYRCVALVCAALCPTR